MPLLTPPSMTIYQDLTRMYRAGDVLGACKKELARTGGAVQTAMREAAASRLKAKGLGRTRATTTKGIPPRDDSLQEEEGAEDVPVQRKAKVSKKADLVADDLKGFGFKRLMAAPTPEIDRLATLYRLRKGAPKDEAVRSLCEKFGKPTPPHKRLADDTSFWELASDVDTHSTDSRRTKSSSRSRSSDSPAMMHAPQQQHQPYADHDLVKQVKALQQQVSQTLGQQQRMVQLEKEKEDMARLLQQERDIVRQQQLKERTSASCLQGNMAAEPSNPRDMAPPPRHSAPPSNFGAPHYDYTHGSIPSSFGPPSNALPNHFASREHNYNNYSSPSVGQPPMNAQQPPNYYAPPRSAPQVHPHALPPSQMAAMSRELTGLKAARMAELEHDMRLAQGWHMY